MKQKQHWALDEIMDCDASGNRKNEGNHDVRHFQYLI